MTGVRGALALLLPIAVACGGPSGSPGLRIALVALGPDVAADSMGPDFPSLDGRCTAVAFASAGEIYVRDLETGHTTHVSAASDGSPANQRSGLPKLSADASHVAFDSAASNLVPGPQNRHDHVFLRNLRSGEIRRISQSSSGEQANDANIAFDGAISVSRDGRFVAFSSYASNLVPGDTNESIDSFVRDTREGRTIAVSVSSGGVLGNGDSTQPSMSGDGRLVVFASDASDLVPGDSNGMRDIFLRDLVAETTQRLTRAHDGGEANGTSDLAAIDVDGRFVAFASEASNLVPGDTNGARDVFVVDLGSGRADRVSVSSDGEQGDGASDYPSLGSAGERVAFVSRATNLVPGDGNGVPDVFVVDRVGGRVRRVSVTSEGAEADDESGAWGIDLSDDGRCVAFGSFATNLLPDDANRRPDLFVVEVP